MSGAGQTIQDEVRVELALPGEQNLVEGLFQFYAYDFSEFAREGLNFDFDTYGRFAVDAQLEAYWREANRWPLIIRVGSRVAGFALINTFSHRGGNVERNMAEFFVARRFRRRSVATRAAHALLRLYPGTWQVAVSSANAAGLAFWPAAIASARNVSDLVRLEGDGTRWIGPIWTFTAHN